MQSIIAQSSTEAEYIASNASVKETVWLRRIASELGFKQKPTQVLIDNQSAKALASTQMTKTLTNHIKVRYHWVREQVVNGEVYLTYVPSKENWSDIMTKIQTKPLFDAFVNIYIW